ncbi:hypothetical protein GF357_03300 [Candidatus Dojkabacteria bacterium]|nr:hypothetical protein [Candidatus Dojkabacteria bacterium]
MNNKMKNPQQPQINKPIKTTTEPSTPPVTNETSQTPNQPKPPGELKQKIELLIKKIRKYLEVPKNRYLAMGITVIIFASIAAIIALTPPRTEKERLYPEPQTEISQKNPPIKIDFAGEQFYKIGDWDQDSELPANNIYLLGYKILSSNDKTEIGANNLLQKDKFYVTPVIYSTFDNTPSIEITMSYSPENLAKQTIAYTIEEIPTKTPFSTEMLAIGELENQYNQFLFDLMIDPNDNLAEADETDNTYEFTVNLDFDRPDLAVRKFSLIDEDGETLDLSKLDGDQSEVGYKLELENLGTGDYEGRLAYCLGVLEDIEKESETTDSHITTSSMSDRLLTDTGKIKLPEEAQGIEITLNCGQESPSKYYAAEEITLESTDNNDFTYILNRNSSDDYGIYVGKLNQDTGYYGSLGFSTEYDGTVRIGETYQLLDNDGIKNIGNKKLENIGIKWLAKSGDTSEKQTIKSATIAQIDPDENYRGPELQIQIEIQNTFQEYFLEITVPEEYDIEPNSYSKKISISASPVGTVDLAVSSLSHAYTFLSTDSTNACPEGYKSYNFEKAIEACLGENFLDDNPDVITNYQNGNGTYPVYKQYFTLEIVNSNAKVYSGDFTIKYTVEEPSGNIKDLSSSVVSEVPTDGYLNSNDSYSVNVGFPVTDLGPHILSVEIVWKDGIPKGWEDSNRANDKKTLPANL